MSDIGKSIKGGLMAVTIFELESGFVSRLRLSELCKLADISTCTAYRLLKNGALTAVQDSRTGRLFVEREPALALLKGEKYKTDFANAENCERMQIARAGKKRGATCK